jgi:hypothetical protein
VFIVDVKPSNIFIYKSQLVKLGNLEITIKADPKDIEAKSPYYIAKGYSSEFVTDEYLAAYRVGTKMTKEQLIEYDKYALIKTFHKAVIEVQALSLKFDKYRNKYYLKIIKDLKKFTLEKCVTMWTEKFVTDKHFVKNMVLQMRKELKMYTLRNIY